MKRIILVTLLTCIFFTSGNAQTIVYGGNVSGVWETQGSPYLIMGDITVQAGTSLSIEPGIRVEFQGHYRFNVLGQLLALGTEIDSIRFTALDPIAGWYHLAIDADPNFNDTTKLEYCILEYGNANGGPDPNDNIGGGIVVGFSKVIISHCLIWNNSCSGIAPWGPAYGGGIYLASSEAILSDNKIINNESEEIGGGIIIGGDAFLYRNVVAGNTVGNFDNGSGIVIAWGANPELRNNTIAYNNKGGLWIEQGSDPLLENCIVYGNQETLGSNVYIADEGSTPSFLYCDIEGGLLGFEGPGSGSNFGGVYENCIEDDPLFVNSVDFNFHLTEGSPCIDAGNPSSPPDPDGSICDIGAYYFDPYLEIQDSRSLMTGLNNYPNPFSSSTTIEFELEKPEKVEISIVNQFGQIVDQFMHHGESGLNRFTWAAGSLPVGIYICRITTNCKYGIKKMVLVR